MTASREEAPQLADWEREFLVRGTDKLSPGSIDQAGYLPPERRTHQDVVRRNIERVALVVADLRSRVEGIHVAHGPAMAAELQRVTMRIDELVSDLVAQLDQVMSEYQARAELVAEQGQRISSLTRHVVDLEDRPTAGRESGLLVEITELRRSIRRLARRPAPIIERARNAGHNAQLEAESKEA